MMPPETLARPLAARVAQITNLPPASNSEPDIPADVVQAASSALDRGETHYADRPGIPELRTLLAEQINQRYSLNYKPSEVTITCGITEAQFCALQVLAKPGTTVICPGSSHAIEATIALIGATLVQDASSQPPSGSVLYLTPNDDMGQWLDQAEAQGWWVLWDVSGSTAAVHPATRPALLPRTLHLDDVGEALAGWRVGWMVGSEKHSELRAFKQAMTICTTNVSQWAALELLRSGR
jgi:aspartate/methionine/tyrosine aminotransferase